MNGSALWPPEDGPAAPAVHSAYSDGGVIGRNPSPDGGTWCWVHIGEPEFAVPARPEAIKASASGIVIPADVGLPAVTNNLTELLAALYCLEALPDGWGGTLYTDSLITLNRVNRETVKKKWNGIPEVFVGRALAASERLGAYRVVLLGGHPSKADLARGRRGNAAGLPVSRWNVYCDARCNALAEKFRRERIEARYAKGGGNG